MLKQTSNFKITPSESVTEKSPLLMGSFSSFFLHFKSTILLLESLLYKHYINLCLENHKSIGPLFRETLYSSEKPPITTATFSFSYFLKTNKQNVIIFQLKYFIILYLYLRLYFNK